MAELKDLLNAVVDMQEENALTLTHQLLEKCTPAIDIFNCYQEALAEIGKRFEKQLYFIPELIMSGEMMKAGADILKPHLAEQNAETGGNGNQKRGKVLMATVQGDIHDIGKNIVTMLMELNGLDVKDIRMDVPTDKIVEEAVAFGADVIGLSGLLTLAFDPMKAVVAALEEKGLCDKIKVIIGNFAVLALALAFFGTGFRDLGFSTWVPKYFREVLALDASYANFLNSFSFLVQFIGTVVGGAMMDAGFSRKALLLFAGVVTAVIAAFSFTLNPSWILPFMFGLGLMAGFIVICCFTGAAWEAASPAEIPWAIALCNFACFVGHLTAPVSVGAVVESHGWLAGTFVLEIGCLAIIVAAVVYTRFSGRRKTPVPPPLNVNGLFSR
jgi:methanogenic corrinoid protein MtbC1